MMYCNRLLLLICLLTVTSPTTAENVPLLINYQGTLEGTDIPVSVTFSIYETVTGGNESPLWQETHLVDTQDGRFSVLLGGTNPLVEDQFDKTSLYLSTRVNGVELLPRQRIVSTVYAIRASQASNVSGEHINPASIVLISGKASMDSAGTLTADSLVVGGIPVIDRTGSWVGQAIPNRGGLGIRSSSSVVVDEAEFFNLNPKWVFLGHFDTFIEFEEPGKLDVSFTARITCTKPVKTRITIKQVSPKNQNLGHFGNIAVAQASHTPEESSVYNQALIDLETGIYRIKIEHRSTSPVSATLQGGSLIARILY